MATEKITEVVTEEITEVVSIEATIEAEEAQGTTIRTTTKIKLEKEEKSLLPKIPRLLSEITTSNKYILMLNLNHALSKSSFNPIR